MQDQREDSHIVLSCLVPVAVYEKSYSSSPSLVIVGQTQNVETTFSKVCIPTKWKIIQASVSFITYCSLSCSCSIMRTLSQLKCSLWVAVLQCLVILLCEIYSTRNRGFCFCPQYRVNNTQIHFYHGLIQYLLRYKPSGMAMHSQALACKNSVQVIKKKNIQRGFRERNDLLLFMKVLTAR